MTWHDGVGMVGVALIVSTYLLVQLRHMEAARLTYPALNAIGAALVIVSLVYTFNLAAFVVEFFWLLISLVGVARWWRERQGAKNGL